MSDEEQETGEVILQETALEYDEDQDITGARVTLTQEVEDSRIDRHWKVHFVRQVNPPFEPEEGTKAVLKWTGTKIESDERDISWVSWDRYGGLESLRITAGKVLENSHPVEIDWETRDHYTWRS